MKVQSLSIVVPTKNHCVNKCVFCVSRTHTNPYNDTINSVSKMFTEEGDNFDERFNIGYRDYFNRLQFARDNGCNVVVLTGTGEPIQNLDFIKFFSSINSKLVTPFKNIEIQTTGVMMDAKNLYNLKMLGVTTISLSISNIFDNERNLEVIGCAEKLKFNVFDVIEQVKRLNFNLRLSLNLINDYDKYSVEDVINRCEELGADQVTFRKLYKSELNNEIDKWIEENSSDKFYYDIEEYVRKKGKLLGVLPFGAKMYNVQEMSMVVDQDCMSEDIANKDTYKYLILRENAKLYTNWYTKASLIF